MRDAAAEEEERAAEEERRRVRKGKRDKLCSWIRARLDLANYPLPSAPCTAVIAECLERGSIFGQPLTGSTLKDYCFRNPKQGLDLLLSLSLDPATALRLRDGPPPKPRVRRAAGDPPVVSAPRRLGPRFHAPAIGTDAAGRDDDGRPTHILRAGVPVCACSRVRAPAPASTPPHMGRRMGNPTAMTCAVLCICRRIGGQASVASKRRRASRACQGRESRGCGRHRRLASGGGRRRFRRGTRTGRGICSGCAPSLPSPLQCRHAYKF